MYSRAFGRYDTGMSSARPASRIRILLLALVVALVFADGTFVAIRYCSPVRLATVVALHRNHGCTLSRAVQSAKEGEKQLAVRENLFKSFRLIETADGLSQWDTPKGRYWIPKGFEHVLAHNLAEQERHIYDAGSVGVKQGDTVLDCGANVGVFTRKALSAGAKLVVEIEPAPGNVACLRRNFANEIASGRVIVCPKGVWDKDDVLELHMDPVNSARDSFVMQWKEATETVKVPLTTVDELVADLKLSRVDFIKMDIEGAEKRALAGSQATIGKYRPELAIAAEHLPDDGEAIPFVVHKLSPQYQFECGPCVDLGSSVTPDVLYFR